jgi:ketosteroid isomerase-like protein
VDRDAALRLLDRLHEAQNDFYAGGGDSALRQLLTPDIAWTVPGRSPVAGQYHGIEEVLGYFARRRDLAAGTFRMRRADVLAGDGDRIAALTEGTAMLGGAERAWSTVGLYAVRGGQIAACWLLPLDPAAFDEAWNQPGPPRSP